ncbi:MAG: hypothetical protein R2712_03000 [Vicinamibacterales bacterium]
MFGLQMDQPPPVDHYYDGDGPSGRFGDYEVTVHHTPGHCPGGVCLEVRRTADPVQLEGLFVGDTLFSGSIGRTDLPGGSMPKLMKSITEVLFRFPTMRWCTRDTGRTRRLAARSASTRSSSSGSAPGDSPHTSDSRLPTPDMILIAVDDLMFSSRIATAAKGVQAPIRFTRSIAAVLDAARTETPILVILDLNSARTDPLGIVAALKTDPALATIPTLGFVSHVDRATIDAARQAGVDRILARSAFVEELPRILAGPVPD